MNLQEMKDYKQKLIAEGHEVYPAIAKIVDTIGEAKFIQGRHYKVLEFDGITLIHQHSVNHAKIGLNGYFLGWIYRDYLFVSVGDPVPLCPFRRDKVMNIYLDNLTTEVTQADRDNEIFVPYHMDWHERLLTLLPKAEGILGEASHNDSQAEMSKLSKELFLEERK
jgi:hypothetical protein